MYYSRLLRVHTVTMRPLSKLSKKGYQRTFIDSEDVLKRVEEIKKEGSLCIKSYLLREIKANCEVRDILKSFGIEVVQNKNGYPELQEDDLEPIAAYGAQYVANKMNMPVM